MCLKKYIINSAFKKSNRQIKSLPNFRLVKRMKKKLLITLAAGAVSYAGLCSFIHYEVFNRKAKIPTKIYESTLPAPDPDKPRVPDPRSEWLKAQDFKEYSVINEEGRRLSGFYLPSDTPSDKFLIGSHGYRSRGKGEFRLMSKYYHDMGFNILLVDHQAAGESEGGIITFGHRESRDLLLWIDLVRNEINKDAQIVLHGVSMGAASVLMLSDKKEILPNVKYIVADCSFSTVTEEFRHNLVKMHLPSGLIIDSVNIVNKICAGYSFYDESPNDCVKNACVPILFIHGGSDDFVPTYMSRENYEACTSEKDILIVDGADHAGSYPTDSASYEKKLEEFMRKYLDKESAAE